MDKRKGNGIVPEVQTVEVPIHMIDDGEKRLDASFYGQDVINARILIDKLGINGINITSVGNLSDRAFWPGRFKRKYVSIKRGKPFLTPSEVFMFVPKARKFVIDFPEEAEIEENWLLITRSGTIGRSLITTKLLGNFVLSDDLIRIIPKSSDSIGYLHAYLNTWLGQAFLTKDRYGATVKHIEPHHVTSIPIPFIPEIEEEISQKVLEAHRLREEAQNKFLEAEEMIYSELSGSR